MMPVSALVEHGKYSYILSAKGLGETKIKQEMELLSRSAS
jgi:hypothetical protein